MRRQLVVLFEHPEWQKPLFSALQRRQIDFGAFDLKKASFDSSGNSQVWKISTADQTIQQVTRDGGFEAYESLDGRTIYYVGGAELRRVPVSGGSWTRVTDRPINHGWWSVSARGIYFAGILPPNSPSRNGPFPVFFLNPLSGLIREVTSIDGPLASSSPDFDISGDGRTLVYSRLEVSTSQIRMLEVRP